MKHRKILAKVEKTWGRCLSTPLPQTLPLGRVEGVERECERKEEREETNS
jgi:hypothetical protein